jgi:hypothetical protein
MNVKGAKHSLSLFLKQQNSAINNLATVFIVKEKPNFRSRSRRPDWRILEKNLVKMI